MYYIYSILAVLWYALTQVIAKKIQIPGNVSPMLFITITMSVLLPLAISWVVIFEKLNLSSITTSQWYWMVICGVINLLAFVLLVKAIKELKDIALKSLTASMLLELIVNSMTEFGIFGHNNYGVLFFQLLIMSVLFSKEVRLSRVQKLRLKIAYQWYILQTYLC